MKVTETHVIKETYKHPKNGSDMTVKAVLEIDLIKGGLFSIKTTTENKEATLKREKEATKRVWNRAYDLAQKIIIS